MKFATKPIVKTHCPLHLKYVATVPRVIRSPNCCVSKMILFKLNLNIPVVVSVCSVAVLCFEQTVGWIRMPLGMEVGLSLLQWIKLNFIFWCITHHYWDMLMKCDRYRWWSWKSNFSAVDIKLLGSALWLCPADWPCTGVCQRSSGTHDDTDWVVCHQGSHLQGEEHVSHTSCQHSTTCFSWLLHWTCICTVLRCESVINVVRYWQVLASIILVDCYVTVSTRFMHLGWSWVWCLLLFWHAPLGVRSAIRRHRPP